MKLFGELEFWFALIKIITIVALIVIGIIMLIIGFETANGQVAISNLWAHGGIFPNGGMGFPQGQANRYTDVHTFSNGGLEISVSGANGYYISMSGSVKYSLLLGKQGAYITLPRFSQPVKKIVLTGAKSGATTSSKVTYNAFSGEIPVSQELTGLLCL